jgi:proteasome lid subunit RPN8/RPN11
VREAGAFLLAHPDDTPTTVRRVVFFDDVDPECMTGSISMSSSAFDALWGICSREHLRVIADVHTHPGTGVGQSSIDRANPMVAVPGHVAIIVPHLAAHAAEPEQCGVHVYHGNHDWSSNLGSTAARLLYIGRWA